MTMSDDGLTLKQQLDLAENRASYCRRALELHRKWCALGNGYARTEKILKRDVASAKADVDDIMKLISESADFA